MSGWIAGNMNALYERKNPTQNIYKVIGNISNVVMVFAWSRKKSDVYNEKKNHDQFGGPMHEHS